MKNKFNVYQYYNWNQYLVGFICSESRQNWIYNSSDNNTPLYVDLYDDFNQHSQLTYYNDDPISDVPVPFIVSCALSPLTFQSVKDSLLTGVGIYYTSDELSRFLAPYNNYL